MTEVNNQKFSDTYLNYLDESSLLGDLARLYKRVLYLESTSEEIVSTEYTLIKEEIGDKFMNSLSDEKISELLEKYNCMNLPTVDEKNS